MKTNITLAFIFITMIMNAQNPRLEKALEKNLTQVQEAKTIDDWQLVTNGFDRIAEAEPSEWLAQYYAGYSNILYGMRQESNDKKDQYYDKALDYINKADVLSPDNSEIYVLKSWVLGMKIGVDPMNRGRELGPESGMLINKATQLNPENPRAYYMMGQSAMYTPEQFGGGKAKAITNLEKAVEKFKTFKPTSSVMPQWGEKQANEALQNCRKM